MITSSLLNLSNGMTMPLIGLGVFQSGPEETVKTTPGSSGMSRVTGFLFYPLLNYGKNEQDDLTPDQEGLKYGRENEYFR